MINDIIATSEDLFKRLERIKMFYSEYSIFPQEANRIVDGLKELAESIPEIKTPENQEQLIKSELKRRLNGEVFSIEQILTPKHYDFDTIISMYGIPSSDIKGLRSWLEANKAETIEAIGRLYQTKDIQDYGLRLHLDVPTVKEKVEKFVAIHIKNYHEKLGGLLQDITKVGVYLRNINAVPTTMDRSYFCRSTNTLAIAVNEICFTTENGNLQIEEMNLITLYGHEGMGHALNQVVTKNYSDLPYFLTKDTTLNEATRESVAQFYQKVILEDLKNSPETQRELGIYHKFNKIYQEAKDRSRLQEYGSKLFQYAITVLADKNIGEPQASETLKRKKEFLDELTLNPNYPLNLVEQYRYRFDSQGNLDPSIVSELRYCAQPVQRALDEFAKQGITYEGEGRSKIDTTLLRGFWTPIGYVDNARIMAKENDKQ